MTLDDPAVERIGVTVDEREDLGEVGRFLRARRRMLAERDAKVGAAARCGPTVQSPRGGGRPVLTQDIRTPPSRDHDLQHGRAAGRRCQPSRVDGLVWHTRAVGLGRTTRFAPLPAGARRVSVMRAGTAGIKALAPSKELLADFQAKKQALIRVGKSTDQAHAEAHSLLGYRERYLGEIEARPDAMAALRALIAEARERDVYLMCMCQYDTPGRACHTYALVALARELDNGVRELPEPVPKRHAAAREGSPAGARLRTP
jgi:hypothetical protein